MRRRYTERTPVTRPRASRFGAGGGRATDAAPVHRLRVALPLWLVVTGVELALRVVGLGRPILYDNRESWGFRPVPDQTRRRLFGARVHVSALGVRGPDGRAGAL